MSLLGLLEFFSMPFGVWTAIKQNAYDFPTAGVSNLEDKAGCVALYAYPHAKPVSHFFASCRFRRDVYRAKMTSSLSAPSPAIGRARKRKLRETEEPVFSQARIRRVGESQLGDPIGRTIVDDGVNVFINVSAGAQMASQTGEPCHQEPFLGKNTDADLASLLRNSSDMLYNLERYVVKANARKVITAAFELQRCDSTLGSDDDSHGDQSSLFDRGTSGSRPTGSAVSVGRGDSASSADGEFATTSSRWVGGVCE